MNIDAHEEDEEYQETAEERRMRDERFVEKFFTERELIVKYDETIESNKEKAHAWYEAVKKTISNLPTYKHDNVGQPPKDTKAEQAQEDTNAEQAQEDTNANKTNIESATKTETKEQTEPGVWFFRGQKDSSFAFTSTLYRRLLNASSDKLLIKTPKEHEKAMLNAELSLLDKARKIGIGRGLTALETLTLLQHHGSPTRLIDITSDWRVGLFFACESNDDRDGRLFLIKIDSNQWIDFPKADTSTERNEHPVWENYKDNFLNTSSLNPTYSWLSGTWPILLPFSDPRMISQRGFFLVGGVPSPKGKGTLYTTNCPTCDKKACFCLGDELPPRKEVVGKRKQSSKRAYVTTDEIRTISSMTIKFAADRQYLNDISKAKRNNWTAVAYSIRVPKHFKRELRAILYDADVHSDSIYPPLRETVRLFEHVVDESLKQ